MRCGKCGIEIEVSHGYWHSPEESVCRSCGNAMATSTDGRTWSFKYWYVGETKPEPMVMGTTSTTSDVEIWGRRLTDDESKVMGRRNYAKDTVEFPGIDYCAQEHRMGEAAAEKYHEFRKKWRGRELGWLEFLSDVCAYGHWLEAHLPRSCGECAFCLEQSGKCPHGWSSPGVCPTCNGREEIAL